MSTEEIRGYVMNAWCIQNEHSLFSSIFQRKWYLTIKLYCKNRSVSAFISCLLFYFPPLSAVMFVHMCASMRYVPSCVCLHYLFAHLLQYVLCSSDCRPFPEPQSSAAALYKQQGAQSHATEESWYCVQHCAINIAICPWLAIEHWECTLKTCQSTLQLVFNQFHSIVKFLFISDLQRKLCSVRSKLVSTVGQRKLLIKVQHPELTVSFTTSDRDW